MCRGIPSFLLVVYTAESWWENERAQLYAEGKPGGKIEEFLIPTKLTIRTGAGEMKRRNPRTRGNIARILVESVATCLGIDINHQTA